MKWFHHEIVPKAAVEVQIAQEKTELAAVPKIPILHFMGSHKRCHICGQIFSEHDLMVYDGNRLACHQCHPMRGLHAR